MPLADDPPHGHFATEYDRLRHESITSLTTISGRAQLMRRRVLRSSGLTELEREWMLDGLATIEAAARPGTPVSRPKGRRFGGPRPYRGLRGAGDQETRPVGVSRRLPGR